MWGSPLTTWLRLLTKVVGPPGRLIQASTHPPTSLVWCVLALQYKEPVQNHAVALWVSGGCTVQNVVVRTASGTCIVDSLAIGQNTYTCAPPPVLPWRMGVPSSEGPGGGHWTTCSVPTSCLPAAASGMQPGGVRSVAEA